MGRRRRRGSLCAALLLTASACHPSSTGATTVLRDDRITVGSFNFPESVLLGEIYAQTLESAGYRVQRLFDLGPRELVMPALQRGLLELVPEYGGSALGFLGGTPTPDEVLTHRRLVAALARRGLTAFAAAPASDRNVFAVTTATARRLGVATLSQLVPRAPHLVLAGPTECPQRPLCLLGLQNTYGMRFKDFIAADAGGPLTTAALRSGVADVALLFSSDPSFDTDAFRLLRDDRGLEPADQVTPILQREVLSRFGDHVELAIDAVSARLTTDALRRMNSEVAHGSSPDAVARRWLARGSSGS
jgi:osmoprotectant transport system substrate-binding protein